MDFTVVGERQLKNVFEVARQHREAAAVGQPIGVERDKRAAENGEYSEPDP